MKLLTKNSPKIIVVLFCLFPSISWAAHYTIPTGTASIDGDTFCGGNQCTSADTIYIEGPRGPLQIKDFNGDASYITITNKANHQAVLTQDGSTNYMVALRNCRYVDLRGDNDPDNTYGIVLESAGYGLAAHVWAWHSPDYSDHIKIGYIQMGSSIGYQGTGIYTIYNANGNTKIYDTFEIHHNYIYKTSYAGMYLGSNRPGSLDFPWIANFSVHHNIMEDMGAYGMTLKGIHADSGTCYVYNNIVRPSERSSTGGSSTGLTRTDLTGEFHQGIHVGSYSRNSNINLYNNWVEKTKGPGLKVGGGNVNVYNNTVVGCGTGNETDFGHGIQTHSGYVSNVNIYDNIIIQPVRYGIYGRSSTTSYSVLLERNLIADARLGEWGQGNSGIITEGTGDNANKYHANVADFGFATWSNDDDLSNDDFSMIKKFKWIGKDQALHTLRE